MGVINISKPSHILLGGQRCRFRLEPHAGKWAGFTCAPAEGLDVDVFCGGKGWDVVTWCQILAGRFLRSRQGGAGRDCQVPKPELQRYFAMTLGCWFCRNELEKKTQDLQSICPKESGNINTTGTFTTIYTTGSFCWFVFPRPMHVQSLSLSLLRMHMSYVFSPKPLHNEPCGKQWLSIVSWLEHE